MKQYKEFVSQVVEKVAAHNPKFFETFGVAITSGDPYRVEKAVTEAERVTKAVLPELSRTLEGGAQGLCVALAAAAVMALAVCRSIYCICNFWNKPHASAGVVFSVFIARRDCSDYGNSEFLLCDDNNRNVCTASIRLLF